MNIVIKSKTIGDKTHYLNLTPEQIAVIEFLERENLLKDGVSWVQHKEPTFARLQAPTAR